MGRSEEGIVVAEQDQIRAANRQHSTFQSNEVAHGEGVSRRAKGQDVRGGSGSEHGRILKQINNDVGVKKDNHSDGSVAEVASLEC